MELELEVVENGINKQSKKVTFYSIEYISPSGKDLCVICSNGKLFATNDTYENVKLKVRDAKRFERQTIKTL